jgi:hypothetical protein
VGERGGPWRAEAEERLNKDRRRAIEAGCAWIASRQNLDGSFGDYNALVACTALSTLALMSNGSTVGRGPQGEAVEHAVKFLVGLGEASAKRVSPPPGFFHHDKDQSSKMHGQGYATLALATALGSASTLGPRGTNDLATRIKRVLEMAVDLARYSQTGTGGWGYEPTPSTEHEGSVTVTVAQGLRAARDAGVNVSAETVKRGLFYLEKSQKLDPGDEEDGSFKYSVSSDRTTYALTAAALSSFYLFGEYGSDKVKADRLERAVGYIKRRLSDVVDRREFFYYGNFYAAWAAWQKDGNEPRPKEGQSWGGDPSNRDIVASTQFWGPWHAKMYPRILARQNEDGKWSEDPGDDRFNFGSLLPTTFAVLTLAIPDEMVPVFQR